MPKIPALVGQNIKFFRQAKGLTQLDLAEQARISASYIGYLERGEKSPSLELLERIAQALDISPAQLLKNDRDIDEPDALRQLNQLLKGKEAKDIQFLYEVASAYFRSMEHYNQ